jgi:protein SCO1/2
MRFSKPGARLRRAAAPGLLLAGLALTGAGCGGSEATSTPRLLGTPAIPEKPAPPLNLRDSQGQPFSLEGDRGKVVLVTFIYTHCPDVCPLIVGNLRTAQNQLGAKAGDLRIVAVSVDPRGDTAGSVNAFLRAHDMTGRMRYLIGSRPELERVWAAWYVLSQASPKKTDPDFVEHSAMVYAVDADGKIAALYPPSFSPGEIVHDVPILASR